MSWNEAMKKGRHTFTFYSSCSMGTVGGLGCHAYYVAGCGILCSSVVKDKTGPVQGLKDAWGRMLASGLELARKEEFPDIQSYFDFAYHGLAKNLTSKWGGIVLLGDRVNRGSAISPGAYVYNEASFGNTANFAAFLNRNPEYGPIYASPIYLNPSHTSDKDYSLCRTWMWFGKGAMNTTFNPKNDPFIGPDDSRYDLNHMIKGTGKTKEQLKVTYE